MAHKKFQKKGLSLPVIILLIFAVASLVIFLTVITTFEPIEKPYAVEVMPFDYFVADEVAFVLDRDILHFGGGPTAATLRRSINITAPVPSTVVIFNNASELSVDKNVFTVLPETAVEVTFMVDIPQNATFGNYSGNITFEFYEIK